MRGDSLNRKGVERLLEHAGEAALAGSRSIRMVIASSVFAS